MRVHAFVCRHFLFTVADDKLPKPRQTCDNKRPYCDSCLAAQQLERSETLYSNLAVFDTLRISESRGSATDDCTTVSDDKDVSQLLEELSFEENVDATIAALQRGIRRELDGFTLKYGEEVAIRVIKQALKAWDIAKNVSA